VLHKEVQSKREVANIENIFITTTMEIDGLNAPKELPPPPTMTKVIR